jgi:hypothetical protein
LTFLWWFSNADADLTTCQVLATEGQSSFEPIQGRKFDITKSFRLAIQLVFNNADICDLAIFEEVVHIFLSGIE